MASGNRIAPEKRRAYLKELIREKGFIRVIEAHNGLSAIIANNVYINNGDCIEEFDAIWESSLTESAAKGYPDANVIENFKKK